MANKTISDLEQITDLTGNLKIPCEGDVGNTSSIVLQTLLEFLHAPVQNLPLTGNAPSYSANPASANVIYVLDLSGINSSDTVNINLPAGAIARERQIIIKVKNPNIATITISQLKFKFATLNFGTQYFQIILDYDQALNEWVAGTLPIVEA